MFPRATPLIVFEANFVIAIEASESMFPSTITPEPIVVLGITTPAVPSKLTAPEETSPDIVILLAVAKAVAVSALPVTSPVTFPDRFPVIVLEKVLAPLNVCVPDKCAVSASKLAEGKTPVTSVVRSIAFLVIS